MEVQAINWIQVETTAAIQQLMDDLSSPLIFFKHSARCPTSRFALKNFEREYDLTKVRTVMINVLTQRELSNFIAEHWQIRHESPQTVIQDTKGKHFSLSHSAIDVSTIKDFLNIH